MDLDRFVDAQDDRDTYDRALSELRAGHKTSHWMWFVFPQVSGLGQSPTAKHYELAGLRRSARRADARPAVIPPAPTTRGGATPGRSA